MTDPAPTRTVSLRVTTTDRSDVEFRRAASLVGDLANDLTGNGLDVLFMASTDHAAAEEHTERDALLALADEWQNGENSFHAYSHCARQLVRLVATLNL